MVEFNGEYECMGDLGMHALHLLLRFGWFPKREGAQLANIVTERPDRTGMTAPCSTRDNATIFGEVETGSSRFPITFRYQRISPSGAVRHVCVQPNARAIRRKNAS